MWVFLEYKVKILSGINKNPNHSFTSDPNLISKADFIAISVPTLITKSKNPDMSYVQPQHPQWGSI
jgi:UDP-N-acetyl-D-mannosaminuronate dehydrogenase